MMKTYLVTIPLDEDDDTVADRLFEAGLDYFLCCHGASGPYIEDEVRATDPMEALTFVVRKLESCGFKVAAGVPYPVEATE